MTTRRNLLYMYERYAQHLVTCPGCLESSPIPLFEYRTHHVKHVHHLKRTDCEFCLGSFRWSPGSLTSTRTVLHQHICFEQFINHYEYIPPEPPSVALEEPRPLSLCDECLQFDPSALKLSMFDRTPNADWKRMGFYDPIFRQPSWWDAPNVIDFDPESGLGQDTAVIFQRFEEFEWYHVSVKAFTFPYFKKYLAPHQDHFAVLPHECLCDGLETKGGEETKHHRHMILAVKKEFDKRFRNIWTRYVRNPNYPKIRGKLFKKIRNGHHLAAVIYYVGQRKSSACKSKDLHENCQGKDVFLFHYWICRPMYPHALLGMCSLIERGLEQFVILRNKQKMVWPFLDIVEKNGKKEYVVPISALNLSIQNCVVPVRRDLKPVAVMDKDPDMYPNKLWLHDPNTFIVFEPDPEFAKLPKEEWYKQQQLLGNRFCENIINSMYVLSFGQRKTMRQLLKVKQQYQEEIKEVKRIMTEKCEATEREMHRQLEQLRNQMQRQIDDLVQENAQKA